MLVTLVSGLMVLIRAALVAVMMVTGACFVVWLVVTVLVRVLGCTCCRLLTGTGCS